MYLYVWKFLWKNDSYFLVVVVEVEKYFKMYISNTIYESADLSHSVIKYTQFYMIGI